MTKRAFVIGDPIEHSLSPALHSYWLKELGITGKYEAIGCPPRYLAQTIKKFVKDGYAGGNVTIPHKEKVMLLCDEVDELAKKVGAVNTLEFKDGKVIGRNTDIEGFIENVSRETFTFSGKNALVLGAGGAARAIILGLKNEGVKVTISNRTKDKAEKLAEEFGCEVLDWEDRNNLAEYNVLVNTTSLGMENHPPLEIDLSSMPKDSLVTDIVYNPLKTDLLIQAEDLGLEIEMGLGMLVYQAVAGFNIWFGKKPNVSRETFEFLEKKLEPNKWVQQS